MLKSHTMNGRIFQLCSRTSSVLLLLLLFAAQLSAQFPTVRRRPDPGPLPKNIHGVVQDSRGKPLVDAKVFVRDMKTNITRTLTTDKDGLYSIYGLPPSVDYEIYAELRGKTSEKRLISAYLNRQDNVLNFQLDISGSGEPGPAANAVASGTTGPVLETFDHVILRASFDPPVGIPAPIPAVLLLHGFGEDRAVWEPLKKRLINAGWAVIALDLRGHGESKTRNQRPVVAAPEWRTSPQEFPLDLDPVLDWIKSQPRLNNRKIAVIGSDIGANLALIASGRFSEVATVVAIKPDLAESFAMAGSAQDFTPRSALILLTDPSRAEEFKTYVRNPARTQPFSITGGTSAWVADTQVGDAIFQWLKNTY